MLKANRIIIGNNDPVDWKRLKEINRRLNAFTCFTNTNDNISKCYNTNGELSGLRVAVKDNFHFAGFPTTCASQVLQNFIPKESSSVVDALLSSGAKIIGKTNMDEFGMGSTCTHSIFGPTRNPLNTLLSAGGSSGGSAAAVASDMVDVALGSDTGGSVRLPAAYCDILGFKPTYGRISRYGLVTYASSLDTVGIMSQNIDSIKGVFSVLTRTGGDRDMTSYQKNIKHYDPKGIRRIGILHVGLAPKGKQSRIDSFINSTLSKLPISIETVSISALDYALATYYITALIEAHSCLARYAHYKEASFGREVTNRLSIGKWMASHNQANRFFSKIQHLRHQLCEELKMIFYSFDLLLCPTTPDDLPPSLDSITFNHDLWTEERWSKVLESDLSNKYLFELSSDIWTVLASLAGIPAISLKGSIQLMAAPGRDEELLSFVAQLDSIASD